MPQDTDLSYADFEKLCAATGLGSTNAQNFRDWYLSSGGGIGGAVIHDATLTGDGSVASPLAVTDPLTLTGPGTPGVRLKLKSTTPGNPGAEIEWFDSTDVLRVGMSPSGTNGFYIYDYLTGEYIVKSLPTGSSYFAFGQNTNSGGFQYNNGTSLLEWFTADTVWESLSAIGLKTFSGNVVGEQEIKANNNLRSPRLTTSGDLLVDPGGALNLVPTGGAILLGGNTTLSGAEYQTGVISPAALPSGDTPNYAPTGFSTSRILRLGANVTLSTLSGIAGGVAGRRITIVNVSAYAIGVLGESALSTAANRFADAKTIDGTGVGSTNTYQSYWYDGTSSRWRAI